jgi:predicted DNA-binding transcriptional regulator AlpA
VRAYFYLRLARPSELKDGPMTSTTKQRPAAQVAFAKKAAADKAKAAALTPKLIEESDLPRGPPKRVQVTAAKQVAATQLPALRHLQLLMKHEVVAITGVTFPTLWLWMRQGKFPRSRIVGGKSAWLASDVEQWLATLPVRPLKGDEAA